MWSLSFFVTHPHEMFNETMHWYEPWARHLLLISMAYFVHDTIDMTQYEISRWTFELLLHHVACLFVFASAILPQKFLLYGYWALLMEVNSIFLHARTISQLSGFSKNAFAFAFIRWANILTFVVFRFCVQAWQIRWVWLNRNRMHSYYFYVGFMGGLFFLAVNGFLFVRILAADGVLGEYGRRNAAINRDEHGMNKHKQAAEHCQ
jgi:hypothetical protein